MTKAFEVGDVVRVVDPDSFIAPFNKKFTDRDAIVVWVGPDSLGQFKNRLKVRFQKRNGRGKEFDEIMLTRDLVRVEG